MFMVIPVGRMLMPTDYRKAGVGFIPILSLARNPIPTPTLPLKGREKIEWRSVIPLLPLQGGRSHATFAIGGREGDGDGDGDGDGSGTRQE
jgi:hypothetical protein